MKFRHKKRGTEYTLVDIVASPWNYRENEWFCYWPPEVKRGYYSKVQGSILEGDLVVIYFDRVYWAREAREFFDGRFERVP